MAYSTKLDLAIFLTACFMLSMVVARPLSSKSTLAARLKLDEDQGSSNCWDSLFELQSCTGEVKLFFLNGETYLGSSCCRAIRTIECDCRHTMLGSLGFTSQEGDILRGYCDASADSTTTPPSHDGNSTTTTSSLAVIP